MADLADVRTWLRFLHVLGVLLFFLAHGASAMVSFRLRKEREPERMRALLDLSAASYTGLGIAFFWVLITGAVLGALYDWWRQAWFWVSLVLFFVVAASMSALIAAPYNRVRRALGLTTPYPRRPSRKERASPPPTVDDVPQILAAAKPEVTVAIGFVGLALLLWLMVFKPF